MWKQNMTVLSLKLSRILDVNTQNALEIFVVVGWGVGGGQGGQKFLLLQKAGICWFTWVLPFVGTLSYNYKTIIFNLIRIFMKGTLLFEVQKIKK